MDANEAKAVAERREFLKRAGKAVAVAPAVALLLNATSVPAQAQSIYTQLR
jgi:hypothetical protein